MSDVYSHRYIYSIGEVRQTGHVAMSDAFAGWLDGLLTTVNSISATSGGSLIATPVGGYPVQIAAGADGVAFPVYAGEAGAVDFAEYAGSERIQAPLAGYDAAAPTILYAEYT